jgi:hypothetical protein
LQKHGGLVSELVAALVLFGLFTPAIAGHVERARDHFTFTDDVRVLIYPQFRLEDSRLFPHDPAADYFLASLPDGYALLYRALTPVVGVVALSKGLPYVLFAATLACLGLAAFRLGGRAALFGSLALALGSSYLLGRMTGGLPRAFAAPLLAAGMLALVVGHARALAALTVVAAGFYPAAALTLGVTLAFLLLLPQAARGEASAWSLRRRLLFVALTAMAAALVLLPSALRLRAWGGAIGPELVAQYPEAGANGRFAPNDRPPFPPLPAAAVPLVRASLAGDGAPITPWLDGRRWAACVTPSLAVLGLLGCCWLAFRRRDARRFLLLPLAVGVCHTASLLVEPRLFLPERYVAYAVPIIVLVAVPATLGALARAGQAWKRVVPWLYNGLVVLVLGARGASWAGYTVHIAPAERSLYAAIARLPRDAVVATFPSEWSDCIPYLAKRSVYLARETHMPFHTRYTELMRARARALIHAYFTSDLDVLRQFRDREHVTHLLTYTPHYAFPPGYFAPFDAQIGQEFEAGKANGFAARQLQARIGVFESGDFTLLDLSKL